MENVYRYEDPYNAIIIIINASIIKNLHIQLAKVQKIRDFLLRNHRILYAVIIACSAIYS